MNVVIYILGLLSRCVMGSGELLLLLGSFFVGRDS